MDHNHIYKLRIPIKIGNSVVRVSLIGSLFMVFFQSSYAQNKTFREEYERFKKQQQEKYDNFRDEANRKYAEFMRAAWDSYQIMPELPKPKEEDRPPVVMPKEDKKPVEDKPVVIDEVIDIPEPEPQPVPVAPIPEQPKPTEHYVSFGFYGETLKVRFNDDERYTLSDIEFSTLADQWLRLSGEEYNNTIRDCLELRIRKKLSDWAYLQLLYKMSQACLGNSNEATMLMAFVYCQSGYKMRLGTANGRIFLLYASSHLIFDNPYFKVGNTMFYPFNGKEKEMKICAADFPSERAMSLWISQNQDFAYSGSNRRTLQSKQFPNMSVTVCVNKNLIDFYNDYPTSCVNDNKMTRWAMYANTPIESELRSSLYPKLKEKLAGLNEKESMERLLNFVQTAFVYEYDNKVWGGDRAFFAEETLYYPYADCEDRAIFLSRLVRDLLGLDVILVFYPGHLAMAVCFTQNVAGDYIMLNGKKYIICDPTYIGAPVGLTMPDMDNATAQVILLQK